MMDLLRGRSKPFVTGGAGFIGSHLVDRLLQEGSAVTVYDNLASGRSEWLEPHYANPRFTFIQADLCDLHTLKSALAGHDVVFHLGANTDIPGGNANTRLDLENCTIATHIMLEAMRACHVDRMVFASSSTVYGELPMRPLSEEMGPLLPLSLYGAGKLACEGLISAYCHLFGLQAWMFRFGNVIGARMGHGVIRDFIAKLRHNPGELEILGDGKGEKNFFLVEDCIDGMLFAYQHATEGPFDVFNLGAASTTTVNEIADIVCEEMGLQGTRYRYTGGTRGWPGDVPTVVYDVSKMRRLGWEAKHTSSDAVRIATRRLLLQEGSMLSQGP